MMIIKLITTALCGGGIVWLGTAYISQLHGHGHASAGPQSSLLLIAYFAAILVLLYTIRNGKYKTFFHWFTLALALLPLVYLFWTIYALKNIFTNF